MPSIKMQRLEETHGDLELIIPKMVNEHGQVKTSVILGVTPSTISRWLSTNGYEKKAKWVKTGKRRRRKGITASRRGRLIPADNLKYLYPDTPKTVWQEQYDHKEESSE